MLGLLVYFLPNKPPTADVAGMRLTRDACAMLIEVCKALTRLLTKQTAEIQHLLTLQNFNTVFASLTNIQERHARIKLQLTDLIHRLRCSHVPWLDEVSDATVAMGGKIKMCNHASKPLVMGWKAAARKYWPCIAENYETIIGLLERLRDELQVTAQDKTLWDRGARKQAHRASLGRPVALTLLPVHTRHGKTTTFSKWVAVRDIAGTELALEGGVEAHLGLMAHKEHTVLLTDYRRRTVEKYSGKMAQSRQLSLEQKGSEAVDDAKTRDFEREVAL